MQRDRLRREKKDPIKIKDADSRWLAGEREDNSHSLFGDDSVRENTSNHSFIEAGTTTSTVTLYGMTRHDVT
jgi:hypothetical protein